MSDISGSLAERAIGATAGPRPRTLSRFEGSSGPAVEAAAVRRDWSDPLDGGGDEGRARERPATGDSLGAILRAPGRDPSRPLDHTVGVDPPPSLEADRPARGVERIERIERAERAEQAERMEPAPQPPPVRIVSPGLERSAVQRPAPVAQPVARTASDSVVEPSPAPAVHGLRPPADSAASVARVPMDMERGEGPAAPAAFAPQHALPGPRPSTRARATARPVRATAPPVRDTARPGRPAGLETPTPVAPPTTGTTIDPVVAPRRPDGAVRIRPSTDETAARAEPPSRPPGTSVSRDGARIIHVSIGRIEVRAVTSAVQPARVRPPALETAPSLDDYLRARNGRSR